MTGEAKRCLLFLLIIFLIGIGIFFYSKIPPSSGLYPKCIFHSLTGLQCPGCGMQRMLNHLFNGEVAQAFRSNIFLFCAIPLILWMIIVEFLRTRHPKLYAATFSNKVVATTAIIVICWTIIRNILGI